MNSRFCVVLSLSAVLLSIVTLGILASCVLVKSPCFNEGTLITTFSVIIALLIGWQINQTLTIVAEHKEMKDTYEKKLSELRAAMKDEFRDIIKDTTELILLRYADKELQLLINSIYNMYRYTDDTIQSELSFSAVKDLLVAHVNVPSDLESISNNVDSEWLYNLGRYIKEKGGLTENDQRSLEEAINKILNSKK